MSTRLAFYTTVLQHNATNSVISTKVQAQKIIGVDDYTQQPQIASVTCFLDGWMETHLLETSQEYSNNISIYNVDLQVRQSTSHYAYKMFGVIDLTTVSYNKKTNIITFTIYDKILLFSRSQDYLKSYITRQTLNDIMEDVEDMVLERYFNLRLTDAYGHGWSIAASKPVLEKTGLQLFTTNREDVIDRTGITSDWKDEYLTYGDYLFEQGFIKTSQNVIFWIECGYVQVLEDGDDAWYYYMQAYKLFNNIQYSLFHEVLGKSEVDADRALNIINDAINGICGGTGGTTYSVNDIVDTTSFDGEAGNYHYSASGVDKLVKFTGDVIPNEIWVGGYLENYTSSAGYSTSLIAVLKAMLTIYNQFLFYDKYQNLSIDTKIFSLGFATDIPSSDIIELTKGRKGSQPLPSSSLDVLTGETDVLGEVLDEYYSEFYSQRQIISASIIDDYNFQLLDDITIDGEDWKITEINPMPKEKLINIVAWRY